MYFHKSHPEIFLGYDKDRKGLKKIFFRELILEKNKKIEIQHNIIAGQKSKNWDVIKQKITKAKVLNEKLLDINEK